MPPTTALFRFRLMLAAFIIGLVVSGVTAFPLLSEMKLLVRLLGLSEATTAVGHTGLDFWILSVHFGLREMYRSYPWIAYGTDWLAFAHVVIAFFFVGPLLHPRGSRSTLYAGVAACLAVIPLALIAGPVRGIPFHWQLIDCSFGLLGILPLLHCLRLLRRIEAASAG